MTRGPPHCTMCVRGSEHCSSKKSSWACSVSMKYKTWRVRERHARGRRPGPLPLAPRGCASPRPHCHLAPHATCARHCCGPPRRLTGVTAWHTHSGPRRGCVCSRRGGVQHCSLPPVRQTDNSAHGSLGVAARRPAAPEPLDSRTTGVPRRAPPPPPHWPQNTGKCNRSALRATRPPCTRRPPPLCRGTDLTPSPRSRALSRPPRRAHNNAPLTTRRLYRGHTTNGRHHHHHHLQMALPIDRRANKARRGKSLRASTRAAAWPWPAARHPHHSLSCGAAARVCKDASPLPSLAAATPQSCRPNHAVVPDHHEHLRRGTRAAALRGGGFVARAAPKIDPPPVLCSRSLAPALSPQGGKGSCRRAHT